MSDSGNESEITVEEALREEEGREVYRMSNELTGTRLSQIDKPKPSICPICRGPFVNAIVTNCNHFFCKPCAQKHHEKNKNCFVCDEQTLGVFQQKMRMFIREPVDPKKLAEEREIAKAKKTMVLEMLKELLQRTNGNKRKMVAEMLKESLKTTNESKRRMLNVEKAVKIAEEAETMLKRAVEKASKANETEIGEFIMVEEAMATMEKSTVKMDKAFEVMVNVYHKNV